MLHKLYSLYDKKSALYQHPYPASNDTTVMRSVQQAIKQGAGTLSAYPEDFDIYQVAEFDDETAKFTIVTPRHICPCIALVPPQPASPIDRLSEAVTSADHKLSPDKVPHLPGGK